jgi:hypothetical protein
MGSLPTTPTSDASPLHEFRDTLRSVALPTAVTPFGPLRKREKPPVIPGQRKPSDTIRPRPPFPAAPTRTVPLSHDIVFDRAAYEASFDRFLDDIIVGFPSPRRPSDFGSAA